MKHCVEVITIKKNGVQTLLRMMVRNADAAESIAWNVAEEMFGSEVPYDADMSLMKAPWFTNDFGERVCVRRNAYGDAAQVEPGFFYL